MLELACAPSFDEPSRSVGFWVLLRSGNPRLFPVDLGRGSLVFSVSCSVRCRSGSLLSPPTDQWQRTQGLPDLTPIADLLLILRDYCCLIRLPPRHPTAWCNFFKAR
ncbi:hypothetical protein SLEP1_g9521 [Rubroshorea leprosula]|uniref:Uncharacterized protein n=1 Tax=Rubroshorea leprosula TaxID=152421 RepID=A0AAV5IEI7_9ROSI|nr:hypothetical protein SLEP1_g9521 [Rubroshorea leprosula]